MSWGQRYWVGMALIVILPTFTAGGRAQVVPDEEVQAAGQETEQPEEVVDEVLEAKREWLRSSLAKQLTSERQLRMMNARVDAMTDAQLDRAIVSQKRKLLKLQREQNRIAQRNRQAEAIQQNQQLQALNALAFRQNGYRAGFADGLFFRRYGPGVAYVPIVTWWPDGASFHAHPVISSSGRHVHINGIPHFSHVGPVNTSDMVSGRRQRPSARDADTKPRVWYDGLRTRYGVPSGPFRNRY